MVQRLLEERWSRDRIVVSILCCGRVLDCFFWKVMFLF